VSIVLEYCENGSIKDYLSKLSAADLKGNGQILERIQLFTTWCRNIADGMIFLGSREVRNSTFNEKYKIHQDAAVN
jgi:hypothetical protein